MSNHVNKCLERILIASSQGTTLLPPPFSLSVSCASQRCKLAAMLLSTLLAYHGGLWCHPYISCGNQSFKDNKTRLPVGIVNTLQHTLVPQISIGSVESLNLDQAQVGTTVTHTHTALWNGKKGGRLHRRSQEATSQASAACCMTQVGAGSFILCVCDYDWIFLGGSVRKDPSLSLFLPLPVYSTAMSTLSLMVVSLATSGISHVFLLVILKSPWPEQSACLCCHVNSGFHTR